ncbi:MAG: hypothetical protein M3373_06185 [Gemmatimonadota bacterium]|nr:hypothetical protein [Gemmatimonadota bacterium]
MQWLLDRVPRDAAPVARRTFYSALLAVSMLGAAACGDDDNGTGPQGITGTYALRQVDGENLPADNDQGFITITVTAGSLVLDDDDTWEMTIAFDIDDDPQVPFEDFGDFDRSGNSITFHSDEFDDQFSGSLSGDEITVDYDFDGDGSADTEFVFER